MGILFKLRRLEENKMSNLDEFKQLIAQHDITYDYSDDNARYQKGRSQKRKITQLAREIPEAKDLWNAEIDRRLSKDLWAIYRW